MRTILTLCAIALSISIALGIEETMSFNEDFNTESFIQVDLKGVSHGVCFQNQAIPTIPPGCTLTNNGAICTIVIDDIEYEIHEDGSGCSNAYRFP